MVRNPLKMKNNLVGFIDNQKISISELGIKSDIDLSFDSQINWAILLTLAGYKEKDSIKINGTKFYNTKDLNNFGSFILNDTRAAPRLFDINTEFLEEKNTNNQFLKNKRSFDSIISFSGGIDSTAGLLMELDKKRNIVPIWVGFGQKNEKNELAVVDSLSNKLGIEVKKIHIDFKDYVDSGWSRWKLGIIPARNYLFASIAANYASTFSIDDIKIWICAHKEEITPINTDKSEQFFQTSTKIFSTFYKKNIQIDTQFRDLTKPEIVSIWHRKWEKKYNIKPQDTVSCYYGNNCGVCKACVNRAVAFTCAGIDIENFLVNPFSDSQNLIKNSYLSRFDSLENERKLDFIYSLKVNYKFLPPEIKDFVDEKYDDLKDDIKKRLILINSADI